VTQLEHRTSLPRETPTGSTAATTAIAAVAGIEMWERFSFYGMQAILVYFLYHSTGLGGIGMDHTTATAVIGAYGAAVYLCTIAGGWVSDRLLGAERTLTGGAVLLVIGHLTMGLVGGAPGTVAGLALIALGSGALKASAVAVLGRCLDRTDTGFLAFYLGINTGAFFGPVLTGWLQEQYGFRAGFSAAAVLMILGLTMYLALRRRYLSTLTDDTRRAVLSPGQPADRRSVLLVVPGVAATVTAVAVLATTGVIGVDALTNGMLVAVILVAVVTFISMLTAPGVTGAERGQIRAFIPLFIGSSVFWAMLNQNFGVLAVYSDLRLDRTLFGWEMPAAWTQSLNPVFLLVAIPVTGWFWSRHTPRQDARATSPARRMSLGVAMAGLGMLVFVPFADGGEGSTPLPVLVTATLLITLGEINVGPVGMAAAGDLAPDRFATRFSALYFLSMAVGTAAAGVLSGFYSPGDPAAERLYFCGCAAVAVVTAMGLRSATKRVSF
jgi:POT family proton-dependent oligopeptide transporter